VRFRASANAATIDIPVQLLKEATAVRFAGTVPGKLSISASFPYAGCAPAGNLVGLGMQGVLGSSSG